MRKRSHQPLLPDAESTCALQYHLLPGKGRPIIALPRETAWAVMSYRGPGGCGISSRGFLNLEAEACDRGRAAEACGVIMMRDESSSLDGLRRRRRRQRRR